MLTIVALLATLAVDTHVEWVCAGNSYMAKDAPRTQCDGWLVLGGDPVARFWQGSSSGGW